MTDERPAFDWRTYWEELRNIAERHPAASEGVLQLLQKIAGAERPGDLAAIKTELVDLSDEDLLFTLRTIRSARKDLETRPGLELVAEPVEDLEEYGQRAARSRDLLG